ncbi:hypothetical protein PF003_g31478 [Phytophthora fragariae]|nr:hypothetical protein PF003_g31478 [Phytophthora fragariae]
MSRWGRLILLTVTPRVVSRDQRKFSRGSTKSSGGSGFPCQTPASSNTGRQASCSAGD